MNNYPPGVTGHEPEIAGDNDDTTELTVTFMRSVTVRVPDRLIPDTMPKRIQDLPEALYDKIIELVPDELGSVDPDDFGELTAVVDDTGNVSGL